MKTIQAKDFIHYKFLSRAAYSPTGKYFSFQVDTVENGDGYASNLWVGDSQGTVKPLTTSNKDRYGLWETDDTLLFSSQREKETPEETQFYRIAVDGGEATKAFRLPLAVQWIEMVEKGVYLVTASVEKKRTDFSLAGVEKETPDDWEPAYHVLEEIPFWGNGEGYLSGKRSRLFLYTEKGLPSLQPLSPLSHDVESVKYHPETGTVFYTAEEVEGIRDTYNALYQCRLNGELTRVSPLQTRIGFFDFYKDSIILSATLRKHHGINENPAIFKLNPTTKAMTPIIRKDRSVGSSVGTDSRLGSGTVFTVSGDTLYCTLLTEYSSRLAQFSLSEDTPEETLEWLTPAGDSVDCFAISAKDNAKKTTDEIIALGFSKNSLAELYRYTGETWEQLTTFHQEFHETYKNSAPEHHTFTASDGFSIDGWVMPPVAYDSTKTYPAILHIHGGPKTVLGEIYHHEMQLWAANGYFVLYCNPRGSDGKGDDFADIRGKYGTIDYENIMEFLDTMLPLYPAIDAERLGVTGGSYGGFMTNWILGHTSRFKAAVTQRSIANWISKAYMGDIGYYFNVDQVLAEHWSKSSFDPEALWNSSPLKYAHNATTPTLIIHASEDYRCPVAEGYQMYTALQLAGVETKMCVFDGENHNLSRSGRPKNRLRRLTEILDWMDRHLKPSDL